MFQKCSNKLYCELCDYKCSKQSVFNKHLTTRKHINNNDNNAKMFQKCPTLYECEFCPKVFKDRAGLWRHNKKCNEDTQKTLEHPERNTDSAMIIELLKQNQEFKEMMIDQSKQIQEQQQKNEELQKQLIETVKVGQHIENQTITNNNNNQKFNLQFFLNEQCKDAINMSEFIQNMDLDIEDLTETGRLGYVGGISRILVNKLQELDIYKRPLHCTDMKRETLYIKENDEWEKQVNSKEKMGSIINKVANKNCRNLPEWTKDHPEYQVFDSPDNMEYMRLTQTVLGGLGEQECKQFKDRIIRGVIKEVMVNK
jgi:bifunctional DNA-binding transcriptional regulator/antitoxin component of YhaV-PrlF toxin-antitoxin module